jgi:hypothetical protein
LAPTLAEFLSQDTDPVLCAGSWRLGSLPGGRGEINQLKEVTGAKGLKKGWGLEEGELVRVWTSGQS